MRVAADVAAQIDRRLGVLVRPVGDDGRVIALGTQPVAGDIRVRLQVDRHADRQHRLQLGRRARVARGNQHAAIVEVEGAVRRRYRDAERLGRRQPLDHLVVDRRQPQQRAQARRQDGLVPGAFDQVVDAGGNGAVAVGLTVGIQQHQGQGGRAGIALQCLDERERIGLIERLAQDRDVGPAVAGPGDQIGSIRGRHVIAGRTQRVLAERALRSIAAGQQNLSQMGHFAGDLGPSIGRALATPPSVATMAAFG